MLELIKSQRFQAEYQKYQTKISAITSDNVREQGEQLLKKLVFEVTKLDNQHIEMFTRSQTVSPVNDTRSILTTLRKQLDKLVTDWEKAN